METGSQISELLKEKPATRHHGGNRSSQDAHSSALASKSNSTGTLGKALEVLDIIALSEHPLRFTDVLARTNQPRGTLHRQLTNLIEEGLVAVNSDHSYSAGVRLLKLAATTWSKNTMRKVAEPFLRDLHELTGETVHLGVLSGLEVIYVDKLESRQSVRMHSQVGNASPLYCTGVGKAMLGKLTNEDCTERASQFDYIKHTPTTLHSPELLLGEMEEIRKTGIARDREEHEPGIRCVAAAFGNDEKGTVAGVSVTAPAFRTDEARLLSWEPLLLDTVQKIEENLDSGLGPRFHE